MSHYEQRRTLIDRTRRGRERISHGWTRHRSARPARGTVCGAGDATAVARYADESIPEYLSDACHRLYLEALAEFLRSLAAVSPDEDHGDHLGSCNDRRLRTQADAAPLYEVKIARAAAAA